LALTKKEEVEILSEEDSILEEEFYEKIVITDESEME
jgi:hypothetical protein